MGWYIIISSFLVIVALYYSSFNFEKIDEINNKFKLLLLNFSDYLKKYY